MTEINRQAYRDAMAYLYCKVRGDQQGIDTVVQGVEDPIATLDAIAEMSLGLAAISTDNQPTLWLDTTRDRLDSLLDQMEGEAGA